MKTTNENTLPNGLEPSPDHAVVSPETRASTESYSEPAHMGPPGVAPLDDSPSAPDYEVGYGKPPKAHQFKKGQSGNPRGAPRKRQVEKVDVGAILSKPVPVKTKRGKKLVHPFEPMLRSLIRRAFDENHLTSLLEILKHFEAYDVFANPMRVSAGGVIQAPPGVDWQEWIDEMMEPIPDNDDIAAPSQFTHTSKPERDSGNDAVR